MTTKMTNTIRFKVTFKNIEFKEKAKNTLKALPGVKSVDLDQKPGELKRILTVKGDEDAKLLMNILSIYGSVHKLIVFKVSFKDQKCKLDALMTAKALKGVVSAELDGKDGDFVRKLTVIGDPDRKTMKQILEIFGTAELIP